MGIKYLQTYMRQSVRNGMRNVSMEDEVRKYKRENNIEHPLIVIDLMSMYRLFYTDNHELILGGRYNVYNERFEILMDRLESMGVRMVFFTDGPAREEKISTCLMRRNDNYEKAMEALRFVYTGADLSNLPNQIEVQAPVPIFTNFATLASKYGDVQVCVLNECDVELAEYATKNNALAIISNDTDFLIFKGDWKFWSSTHIDVATLTTKEYNRRALQETLSLRDSQLALFATLCGNDIVQYDSLQQFHNRINQPPRQRRGFNDFPRKSPRFQAVARHIKSFGYTNETITDSQIRELSKHVFGVERSISGAELIKSSLKSYDYTKLDRNFDSEFLSRLSQTHGRLNYILLTNIKYIVQLHHFDLSKKDLRPFFDIISPLIRRTMGVLLKNETRPVVRTFYCKLSHTRDYEATTLEAEFPPYEVPALEELLFEQNGTNETLDNSRMDLLCWQISGNLIPALVQSLPTNNVANCLTLFYLVEVNCMKLPLCLKLIDIFDKLEQINIDEADCLLLACNCPEGTRDSLRLSDMKRINERDARIAFLFTAVLTHIKNCLYAVGLSHLCTLVCFDGLYFHSLRQKLNTVDKRTHLMEHETLRIYAAPA